MSIFTGVDAYEAQVSEFKVGALLKYAFFGMKKKEDEDPEAAAKERQEQAEKALQESRRRSMLPAHKLVGEVIAPGKTTSERLSAGGQALTRAGMAGMGLSTMFGYGPLARMGLQGQFHLYHGTPITNLMSSPKRAHEAAQKAVHYMAGAAGLEPEHVGSVVEHAERAGQAAHSAASDLKMVGPNVHKHLEAFMAAHPEKIKPEHLETAKGILQTGTGIAEGGINLAHAGRNFRLNTYNLMNAAARHIEEATGKQLSHGELLGFMDAARDAARAEKPVAKAVMEYAQRFGASKDLDPAVVAEIAPKLKEYGMRVYHGYAPHTITQWSSGESELGMLISKLLKRSVGGAKDIAQGDLATGAKKYIGPMIGSAVNVATGGLASTVKDEIVDRARFAAQFAKAQKSSVPREELQSHIKDIIREHTGEMMQRMSGTGEDAHQAAEHAMRLISPTLRKELTQNLIGAGAHELMGMKARDLEEMLHHAPLGDIANFAGSVTDMTKGVQGMVDAAKSGKGLLGVMGQAAKGTPSAPSDTLKRVARLVSISRNLEQFEGGPMERAMQAMAMPIADEDATKIVREMLEASGGGLQAGLRSTIRSGQGGLRSFVDFPVIGHLLGTNKGLADLMGSFIPNYSPGRDISLGQGVAPEEISRIYLSGDKGLQRVVDIEGAVLPKFRPTLGSLKTFAKYAPMAGLGANILTKAITGKGLIQRARERWQAHKEQQKEAGIQKEALSPALKAGLTAGGIGLGLGTAMSAPAMIGRLVSPREDLSHAEKEDARRIELMTAAAAPKAQAWLGAGSALMKLRKDKETGEPVLFKLIEKMEGKEPAELLGMDPIPAHRAVETVRKGLTGDKGEWSQVGEKFLDLLPPGFEGVLPDWNDPVAQKAFKQRFPGVEKAQDLASFLEKHPEAKDYLPWSFQVPGEPSWYTTQLNTHRFPKEAPLEGVSNFERKMEGFKKRPEYEKMIAEMTPEKVREMQATLGAHEKERMQEAAQFLAPMFGNLVGPSIGGVVAGGAAKLETDMMRAEQLGREGDLLTSAIPSEKLDRFIRQHPALYAGGRNIALAGTLLGVPAYVAKKHYRVTGAHLADMAEKVRSYLDRKATSSYTGTSSFSPKVGPWEFFGNIARSPEFKKKLLWGVLPTAAVATAGAVAAPHYVRWSRKKKEEEAAEKEAAVDPNKLTKAVELAGLGMLGVPSAYHLLHKKKPEDEESRFHRLMQDDKFPHIMELAGLGALAAPYTPGLSRFFEN